MLLGTTFPVTDLGAKDPGVLRAYAEAVEGLGYDLLLLSEHVLGADLSERSDWRPYHGGPPLYNHRDPFHEPMVAFGYLAAVTKRVKLMTGVMVLPQRQAALVAKQAAEIDVLSGGRLILGIGSGWNDVESEALGMEFRSRGARIEEQVALMRALWTQEVVTFKGRWHTVTAAGINPLPVQRPIPVWFGGQAPAVLDRAARIGDGVYGGITPDARGRALLDRLRETARQAGRDPSRFGVLAALTLSGRRPEELVPEGLAWQETGATHGAVRTVGSGFTHVDQHIAALRRFKEAWDKAR